MWLNIGIIGWLSYCAWLDWKHRQVPNWLLFAPLPVVLGVRLLGLASGSVILILWIFTFTLAGWALGWIGGADVKGTMILAICDPGLAMFAWGGSCIWYPCFRIFFRNEAPSKKLPGFPGFLLGAIAYILCAVL